MRLIEIVPTNTCPPDIKELGRRTKLYGAFAPQVQLDVSDGLFSSVTSWPYGQGQYEELRRMADQGEHLPYTEQVLYETHLMVKKPREVGLFLIRAGVRRVMGHIEAFTTESEARETLNLWRENGAEAGLAVLFKTPFEAVESLVSDCDVVLLMSIASIGAQGIPYEPSAPTRVAEFRARHPEIVIAVDGGVSEMNIADLVRAGASRFGVGSAITKSSDPKAAYEKLKNLAENALQ